jgi:hypothetical protein
MGGYTGDFALVCEGVTDHAVLKNILLGYFKNQPRAPRITQKQPDSDATGEAAWQQFGNWENVFRYIREGLHREALQFNEFLVVQVDSDDSEHVNFGVPQQHAGQPHPPEVMVRLVAARLGELFGDEDLVAYEGRLIFAICVRSIECWLLPLWETDNKAAKTAGCLHTLNAALARKNEPTINPNDKKVPPYDNASRGYRQRPVLLAEGAKNPSLAVFLAELNARAITLSSDRE